MYEGSDFVLEPPPQILCFVFPLRRRAGTVGAHEDRAERCLRRHCDRLL